MGWGGGGGRGAFLPLINRHFPLFSKINILIFYVPCSPKLPFFPCSLHFRPLFPCSPEINCLVPLFPNPGKPHLAPFQNGTVLLLNVIFVLCTEIRKDLCVLKSFTSLRIRARSAGRVYSAIFKYLWNIILGGFQLLVTYIA